MIDWLPSVLKGIGDAGVANVLREKVGLLDIQRAQAVAERDTLATQLAQAKAKIEVLESDKADSQAQLDSLRQEIDRLRHPPNPYAAVQKRAIDMLVEIAKRKDGWALDSLFNYFFGKAIPQGEYFFAQLVQAKLVEQLGVNNKGVEIWGATQKGKDLAFGRPS